MTIIVAAHPDDEVIGAGAQLPRLSQAHFVHLTDGAPKDMRDASALGFMTREAYAEARRREFFAALSVAGIHASRAIDCGVPDQEAAFTLNDLTTKLFHLLAELQPRTLFTHAYEGGHPDHDAAAFICRAACRLMQREHMNAPVIFEFASYHAMGGQRTIGHFLPNSPASDVMTFKLTEQQREFKRGLFDCFQTQKNVLADFPIECERFRLAPAYDFTAVPHQGPLYYETLGWGITGKEWTVRAREALQSLDL